MIICGIDPGNTSGGIALIDGHTVIATYALSKLTKRDVLLILAKHRPIVAYLEKVHSMPRDAAKTAFSFGGSFHSLEMALLACDIRYELVSPQRWQKLYPAIKGAKGESSTQKKNKSKAEAQRLYPFHKITHANADALLIANYGYTQEKGK